MTFTQIAQIADLIAALGIIATLLFLVFELRQNARQASYANWQGIIGFVRSHREWSSDPAMAEIVSRGRMDYRGLSEGEKFAFENWMMNGLTAFYTVLIHKPSAVAEKEGHETSKRQIRHLMSFPGTIDCWEAVGLAKRYPPSMVAIVEGFIREYREVNP